RLMHPDPAEVAAIVTTPTSRLWERRPGDEHLLALRCGTVDLPSVVEVQDEGQQPHQRSARPTVSGAPAVVRLGGPLGVAGAAGAARRLGWWLVAQAAALHSPRDLSVYLLLAAVPRRRGRDRS